MQDAKLLAKNIDIDSNLSKDIQNINDNLQYKVFSAFNKYGQLSEYKASLHSVRFVNMLHYMQKIHLISHINDQHPSAENQGYYLLSPQGGAKFKKEKQLVNTVVDRLNKKKILSLILLLIDFIPFIVGFSCLASAFMMIGFNIKITDCVLWIVSLIVWNNYKTYKDINRYLLLAFLPLLAICLLIILFFA